MNLALCPQGQRLHTGGSRWVRAAGRRGQFLRASVAPPEAPPVSVANQKPGGTTPLSSSPSSPASGVAAPSLPPPPTPTIEGYLSLLVVPVLWGTYNPCIRYLYGEPDPLDAASLTAVRTALSAGALLLPALLGWAFRRTKQYLQERKEGGSGSSEGLGPDQQQLSRSGSSSNGSRFVEHSAHTPAEVSTALAGATDGQADGVAAVSAATAVVVDEQDHLLHPSSAASHAGAPGSASGQAGAASTSGAGGIPLFSTSVVSGKRLGPVLTRTFDNVIIAGLELGLLNFLGTALQVQGLQSVSATRAGFLAEVTAVLTPFVSYLAGYEIPKKMWVAVGVGLVGSTLVAYDTSQVHEVTTAVTTVVAAAAAAAPATSPETAAAVVEAAASSAAAASSLGVVGAAAESAVAAASAVAVGAVADAAGSAGDAAAAVAAVTAEGGALTGAAAVLPAATSSGAALGAVAALDGAAARGADAAASLASASTAGAGMSASTSALGGSSDGLAAAALPASSTTTPGASAALVAASPAAAVSTSAPAPAPLLSDPSTLAVTGGESLLLLACMFFSICTIRMGLYAPRMDTVSLAAMKKVGLSGASLIWMAVSNLQHGAALDSVLSFPDLSTRNPTSVAVLLYSGLGPGALATFLQVSGLSTVPATTAQVLFSMTPLWSALFAYIILGGEGTSPVAWVGGSLIIGAAIMAARAQQEQMQQQQEEYAQAQLDAQPAPAGGAAAAVAVAPRPVTPDHC